MSKRRFILAASICVASSFIASVYPADNADGPVAALSSPDITQRRAAIDAVQTLDDPAIPAACLALLKDRGLSIRRQAARAIGSRFAQVPADQRSFYVKALEACAAEGPEDVTLLCQRAVGLLTANYHFPSFSVSPRGRWVLYERRRLPVIARIDADGGKHTLLSPVVSGYRLDEVPDLLKLAITNETAETLFTPHWHPGGDAVAFTPVLQRRFLRPVCIWVAGRNAVKILEPYSMKAVLPPRYPAWGTTSDFVRWEGNKVIVRIYDCDAPSGPRPDDPGVCVSYDIVTKKLAFEGKFSEPKK